MTEKKKGWRERHMVHLADDMKAKQESMKERYEARKSKEVGESKPETVKKVQGAIFVVGLIITVAGVVGLLLVYAC